MPPTTVEVLRGHDLTGRTAVVTGGSSGLGRETALRLAGAGATVVLADRDDVRAEQVAEALRDETASTRVTSSYLDLAAPDSIRVCAAGLLTRHPTIDLLVNNAGTVNGTLRRTAGGIEHTLAVNFLGHFLLTNLLRDALVAAPAARVVNLGSGAHRHSPMQWDDLDFHDRPYTPRAAYAQSKTADALFTLGLERRWTGSGVHAFTARPAVVETSIYRDLTAEQQAAFSSRVGGQKAGAPVEVAAATTVWACVEPALDAAGGAYLAECAVVGTPGAPSTDGGHAPWIFDPAEADRLWAFADSVVGEMVR